jgi:protein-tyrosine phosphatase
MTWTCIHNHLIPGVDDGARDAEFSAGARAALRREGGNRGVTTPHFMGSLTHNDAAVAARLNEFDEGWRVLRDVVDADAAQFGSAMRVERGAEVMLDVPDPKLDDPRIRLAGSAYVLVEYPALQLPPVNAAMALGNIRRAGWIPVLAHAERYRNLESLATLNEFIAAGALLQVNAGSLFGDYGSRAQARAQEILTQGLASFVCSDYHARGEPGLARFGAALNQSGFSEQAELLLSANPGRILTGEPMVRVPPMTRQEPEPPSWWTRLTGG